MPCTRTCSPRTSARLSPTSCSTLKMFVPSATCALREYRSVLTLAVARGNRFLLGRAPSSPEHSRLLGQYRPAAQREPDLCRDHGTRFVCCPPARTHFLPRQESVWLTLRSASDVRAVDRDTLGPILFLLENPDIEVQRAASAALGNLAVNSMMTPSERPLFPRTSTNRKKSAENKVLIVQLGGLQPLIRQMMSTNVEVQCNAVGCITNLATHEDNKAKIARSGALGPLTRLAKSKDMRVQRNATGALLNMTHSGMCDCPRLSQRHDLLTRCR